mgnify:FL=1
MHIGIFLNGSYEERDRQFYVQEAQGLDKIIATDQAGELLKRWSIPLHLSLGDFDRGLKVREIEADEFRWYIHNKDRTDGELAAEAAWKEKPAEVSFYGYLPREQEYDHFYGNLGLLYDLAHRGIKAVGRSPGFDTYFITDNFPGITFSASLGDIVSLATYGCFGVASTHTEGLKWQVHHHDIFLSSGKYLRNEAVAETVLVRLDDVHLGDRGNLLIFHQKQSKGCRR